MTNEQLQADNARLRGALEQRVRELEDLLEKAGRALSELYPRDAKDVHPDNIGEFEAAHGLLGRIEAVLTGEGALSQPAPVHSYKRAMAGILWKCEHCGQTKEFHDSPDKGPCKRIEQPAPEPVKVPEGIVLPFRHYQSPFPDSEYRVIRDANARIVAEVHISVADWICAALNAAGGRTNG